MMCLLTPNNYASYAVPVRQYRILQSRFLQCMPHDKPPCGLLTFPGVTPACKGLSPIGRQRLADGAASGKKSHSLLPELKEKFVFF
jgi:hypothetical protein